MMYHTLFLVHSLIILTGMEPYGGVGTVNGERICKYYESDLAPGSQFDLSISQNVASAFDCCNMCLANPSCKGFVHNAFKNCYQKNTNGPLRGLFTSWSVHTTSGIIQDFDGPDRMCQDIGANDIESHDLIAYKNTLSYDDCCKKCTANRDCNGFVFSGKNCWLKYATGNRSFKLGYHSGVIKTSVPQQKLKGNEYLPGLTVSETKSNLTWIYILGTLLLLVLTAVLLLIWRNSLRNKELNKAKLTEHEIEEFHNGVEDGYIDVAGSSGRESANPDTLPYETSYEISMDRLIIDKRSILGSGQFGIVYGGSIVGRDGVTVAIKTTKPNCSLLYFKSLLSELKLLLYIGKHPNIIELIGANTENIRFGAVYIVMEQCQLGDLQTHLGNLYKKLTDRQVYVCEGENSSSLSEARDKERALKDFWKWSYQIANAMEYLSSKNVIHADLAARNVLLTLSETAKLSDFGLSRKLYHYLEYVKKKQEPLPWKWMALESLKTLTFSTKSDVWSYGVLLWEIFSFGQIPYGGLAWESDFARKLEVDELRLSKPDMASEDMYSIMRTCWENDPKHRPDFGVLKRKFEDPLKNTNFMEYYTILF